MAQDVPRTKPPQPSPAIVQLLNTVGEMAARLGIQSIVVAVKDPSTGALVAVKSPAIGPDLRSKVASVLGLADLSDTEWS